MMVFLNFEKCFERSLDKINSKSTISQRELCRDYIPESTCFYKLNLFGLLKTELIFKQELRFCDVPFTS